MNTGISRFVIRFPEKIALLEGLVVALLFWIVARLVKRLRRK
jgi:hypothetical protein